MFQVQEVSDVDMAFPANVMHLMPKYEEIPKEFKDSFGSNPWVRLQKDWFYYGLKSLELTPKDGIDTKKALRHLHCIQASFEPKHEHKEAAVAYLLSLWFESGAKWERKDADVPPRP